MVICTPSSRRLAGSIALGLLSLLAASVASAGVLKAEYLFESSFASSLAGAPALVAVNPNATNAFVTDSVFGESRQVYASNGTGPSQAGLTLATTGLVAPTDYSVEMVFAVTGGGIAYKRLLRTNTSDNGLYVDAADKLNTYDSGSHAGSAFSLNTYHDLVVTVSGNQTQVWLDGALSHSLVSSALNLTEPAGLLRFYLDENQEFTNAKTAVIRMWDGTLSNAEITALWSDPLTSRVSAVPEPSVAALLASGLGLMGWATRRRRSAA